MDVIPPVALAAGREATSRWPLLFCEASVTANVYVDGFNLYYGALVSAIPSHVRPVPHSPVAPACVQLTARIGCRVRPGAASLRRYAATSGRRPPTSTVVLRTTGEDQFTLLTPVASYVLRRFRPVRQVASLLPDQSVGSGVLSEAVVGCVVTN